MKKAIHEIMLIDDDIPTNYLSKLVITEKNCCETISTVSMATEAIDILKEHLEGQQKLPDVILLDLNMPKMNGWEFMEVFNQLNLKEQQPRIHILTTSMNPDDRIKALNTASISGFHKKPLNDDILDQIIAEFEVESS